VIATEDQVTKHFYQNKSEKYEKSEFIEQKTPSEIDSLDEEFSSQLIVSSYNTKKTFFFSRYSFREKEQQLLRLLILKILFLIEYLLLFL